MKTLRKSILIWYTPQEMYDLVVDIEHYPKFLPWCSHTRISEQHADGVTAEIGLSLSGIKQSFTTRNHHEPGVSVQLNLVKGPFSKLQGHWRFLPVGDADHRACRVELDLNYGFSNALLANLVGPIFDRIANSLMEAFVQRAEHVYGS
jgi:ribosome-associated toxin RatA of RatAB toxin-antitoxin module